MKTNNKAPDPPGAKEEEQEVIMVRCDERYKKVHGKRRCVHNVFTSNNRSIHSDVYQRRAGMVSHPEASPPFSITTKDSMVVCTPSPTSLERPLLNTSLRRRISEVASEYDDYDGYFDSGHYSSRNHTVRDLYRDVRDPPLIVQRDGASYPYYMCDDPIDRRYSPTASSRRPMYQPYHYPRQPPFLPPPQLPSFLSRFSRMPSPPSTPQPQSSRVPSSAVASISSEPKPNHPGTDEDRGKPIPRTFEESFQVLLDYKRKHGHVMVPQKSKEDPRLGHWVKNIRCRPYNLSKEEKEMLDSIGFKWAVNRRPSKCNKQQSVEEREK